MIIAVMISKSEVQYMKHFICHFSELSVAFAGATPVNFPAYFLEKIIRLMIFNFLTLIWIVKREPRM